MFVVTNETYSGRLQREFDELEQRANVVRRLLQTHYSVQSRDTLELNETIQITNEIEKLARLAQRDSSEDSGRIRGMIATLRIDLRDRIDRLGLPEISGGEV